MADSAIDLEPGLAMSRADYWRWAEAQPSGRFERIDGVVVAMAPERLSRQKRKALVWLALHQAVQATDLSCEVYPDGATVEVDDNDFEPDAILRCGDALPGDGCGGGLSPRTRQADLTRKMVAYFRIPSVRHYLIFWADQPQVIHHRRLDDDTGSIRAS